MCFKQHISVREDDCSSLDPTSLDSLGSFEHIGQNNDGDTKSRQFLQCRMDQGHEDTVFIRRNAHLSHQTHISPNSHHNMLMTSC